MTVERTWQTVEEETKKEGNWQNKEGRIQRMKGKNIKEMTVKNQRRERVTGRKRKKRGEVLCSECQRVQCLLCLCVHLVVPSLKHSEKANYAENRA